MKDTFLYSVDTGVQSFAKIQLCLSNKATLQFLDVAAEEYDEKVHIWRDSLRERTASPGNSVRL